MSDNNGKEKYKILIVESNTESETQLLNIISRKYDVIKASSGEEAIKLIADKQKNIASAIIYIQEAADIVRRLRASILTEKFPILISTDIDNSKLEDELLALNVMDFLKKPFSDRQVLNRLKTAVKLFEANRIIYELERDELTGLLTRKAFLRKTEQFINNNRKKNFCIIAFDFDNFKSSNSLYGVEKCNEFLSYSAREMMKAMPEGFSGRYGGDQYILFFNIQKKLM